MQAAGLVDALKHAAATAVTVEIVQNESQVTLTVHDNGKGFEPAHLHDKGGMTDEQLAAYGICTQQQRMDSSQFELRLL